ncbi:MAG: hypothetical protein HY764_01450 [Candidatus Portnoybacteria bacterium]|nr:hypothetical protein [Candidatus Portnoybacteria bacterium]
MPLYIDVCTYDDYDKVVRYLLEHEIHITDRNKMRMFVGAEISEEQTKRMIKEISPKETITFGPTPLG